ncbi:MAG: hypothetical protein JST11_22670 [Acidobacteria bacterium]|nr:hypothetical protein [Acidobacteriota bacterium]
MADGRRVSARDLELADALGALPPHTLKAAREAVELDMVQEALRRHRGKITAAALELGSAGRRCMSCAEAGDRAGSLMASRRPLWVLHSLSVVLTPTTGPGAASKLRAQNSLLEGSGRRGARWRRNPLRQETGG